MSVQDPSIQVTPNQPSKASGNLPPIRRDRQVVPTLAVVVLLFLAAGAALCAASGSPFFNMFINPTALAWVVLAPPALLLPIFGWAGLIDAFSYIFRRPTSGRTADDAATVFRLWAAMALACGFLSALVGIVTMLSNVEDPSSIGAGMAFTLVGQVYGVVIATIGILTAAHVSLRHNGSASIQRMASQTAGLAGITVVAGTLTVLVGYGILMLAMPAMGHGG